MPRFENLSSRVFGLLTVDKLAHKDSPTTKTKWVCKCACGNAAVVTAQELKRGDTKSCGCIRKIKSGERLRKRDVFSAARMIQYRGYTRIRQKNVPFDLTEDEFEMIASGGCYYCGKPPKSRKASLSSKLIDSGYFSSGIDRIDPDKSIGYTIENCVSCCKECNVAKNNMKQEDFILMCVNVAKRHGAKIGKKVEITDAKAKE